MFGTVALSLATFMNVLDSSIANVSIPAIAGPHTPASTGLLQLLMARRKRNTGESCVAGGLLRKSAMSLPAENTDSCPCTAILECLPAVICR